jgi:sugar lactone lactonase YvrE
MEPDVRRSIRIDRSTSVVKHRLDQETGLQGIRRSPAQRAFQSEPIIQINDGGHKRHGDAWKTTMHNRPGKQLSMCRKTDSDRRGAVAACTAAQSRFSHNSGASTATISAKPGLASLRHLHEGRCRLARRCRDLVYHQLLLN